MKRNLGPLETQFFAYIQMRNLRQLRVGDLRTSVLRLSPERERKLLSRLLRGGLIARVRKGLYLVPAKLPLGGGWTPGELEALAALMADAGARYQVCGPSAFNRHGFDEQIPNRLYAYNTRLSGTRKIGALQLTLIKVSQSRLGKTEKIKVPGQGKVCFSSRTRSLVDAVYDWSRFNGIPRGYEWIRSELAARRVTAAELVLCTLRYGDSGTIRRVGALLERNGVAEALLRRMERALRPTRSTIPWIPSRPKRGTISRRWGVVFNEAT